MLLLDSLELRKTARRPVWIMRQAGRYLSSYQELKKKYSFKDFASNADLATKVSLLPMKQYDLDASVVFSDILLPLEAFGVPLEFTDKGPQLKAPNSVAELKNQMQTINIEQKLSVILKTIGQVRNELSSEKAVLGFAGAPFTMLSYWLEGKLTKDLGIIKKWMAKEPETIKKALQFLAEFTGEYLDAQARAGANAVQLFDTWASVLSAEDYEEFALPYVREAISQVTVPCIYYVNGCSHLLPQLSSTGAQCLSVDWRVKLGDVRSEVSQVIALQGNMDPYHLLLPPDQIRQKVFDTCSSYGTGPGHIVNLGHGIVPVVPEKAVENFISAVHEWSAQHLA